MRRAPLLVLSVVEGLALLASSPVYAQTATDGYYTIASVTVEKVDDLTIPPPEPGHNLSGAADPIPPLDPTAELGTIINIGKQVWDIIVANKPVVDVQTGYAAAMPKGVVAAEQLSGWKAPEATVYEMAMKNVYGTEVVRFRYAVLRTYGGTVNGRGKYLTGVAVQPLNLDVLWGYKVNVSAGVKSTTNAGSVADPIGALMLVLDWKVATPIKESRGSGVYYVQGDGVFKDVANGPGAHKVVGPFRVPQWDLRLSGH